MRPVAGSDCRYFRVLLSLVGLAHCQMSLKSPSFCNSWRDQLQWPFQLHPCLDHASFFRNMEILLLGKGVRRQTDCHFRGVKIGSLCGLIFIHFPLHWFTSAGFQEGYGNKWVTTDGSQTDKFVNSLDSWWVRDCRTQYHKVNIELVQSHNRLGRVHTWHMLFVNYN